MTDCKEQEGQEEGLDALAQGELMVAPMVRAGTLAFRMLCRSYGARTAYTPAIVDLKLVEPTAGLRVRRVPLPAYGAGAEAVELYCAKDATPVLTTLQGATRCPFCEHGRALADIAADHNSPHEPPAQRICLGHDDDDDKEQQGQGCACACGGRGDHPLVVQLGSADAETAVRAADVVAAWADGLDVNAGCAMQFAAQGGMGVELLRRPDALRAVLAALVRRHAPAGRTVSCKTRLLDAADARATARLVLAHVVPAGCRTVALHARTPAETARTAPHWATLGAVRAALAADADAGALRVIANGGVRTRADIAALRRATRCADVMLGTAAIQNAAVFGAVPRTVPDVARDLLRTVCRALTLPSWMGGRLSLLLCCVCATERARAQPAGPDQVRHAADGARDAARTARPRARRRRRQGTLVPGDGVCGSALAHPPTAACGHVLVCECRKVWGLEDFYEHNRLDE